MALGKRRLRSLRHSMNAVGLTQRLVARDLGLSQSHVCHVMAGRHSSERVVRYVVMRLRQVEQFRQTQLSQYYDTHD